MKALELSKYIVAKFDDVGDLITNKKLQKLLYYIEAWSLVYFSSLIEEEFEAWVHGPVVPSVYKEYKCFGYSQIRIEYKNGSDPSKLIKKFEADTQLEKNQIELINQVIDKYGVLSSYELELLSHSEQPWLSARINHNPIDRCSNIIDKILIKEYYSSLVPK